MPNGWDITPVNIPGIFGAIQQAQMNQQGIQFNQMKMDAFKKEQEREKRVSELKRAAIAGDQSAEDALIEYDMDWVKGLDAHQKSEITAAFDATTNLAKRAYKEQAYTDPQKWNSIVDEALAGMPNLEGKVKRFEDFESPAEAKSYLEGIIAQTQTSTDIFKNPEKWEDIRNDDGELIGQRNLESNKFNPISNPSTIKAPSGYRFVGDNLEPIPGGPGEAEGVRLTLQQSRDIAARTGEFFGGTYDPITLRYAGLEKGQEKNALAVQVRANEIMEDGGASNPAAAVQLAAEELGVEGATPKEPDEQMTDEKAAPLVEKALGAIENGRDPITVLAKLKELGVSVQQARDMGITEEYLKNKGITVEQLKAAGII